MGRSRKERNVGKGRNDNKEMRRGMNNGRSLGGEEDEGGGMIIFGVRGGEN